MQIGFIGSGNMARALALGWEEPVLCTDSGSGRAKRSRTVWRRSWSTGASGSAKAIVPQRSSTGVLGSTRNTGVSG